MLSKCVLNKQYKRKFLLYQDVHILLDIWILMSKILAKSNVREAINREIIKIIERQAAYI